MGHGKGVAAACTIVALLLTGCATAQAQRPGEVFEEVADTCAAAANDTHERLERHESALKAPESAEEVLEATEYREEAETHLTDDESALSDEIEWACEGSEYAWEEYRYEDYGYCDAYEAYDYAYDYGYDYAYDYSDYADTPTDMDLRTQGVIYDGGTAYTWYSQNVLPGGGLDELNANGRHVDEGGYVVDGDGRMAVASSDYEVGTVLDTPWGEAVVYDTGCPSGVVDVYVDW